jgi:hypothetical protein
MNPLIQLHRQLQYLFIALLLACFAMPAMGERDETPNHKKIILNSIRNVQCAGENVDIRGELKLKFGMGQFLGVRQFGPVDRDLQKGFSGNCPNSGECLVGIGKTTKRRYMANKRIAVTAVETKKLNGLGVGTCTIRLFVTGNPNPRGEGDPCPGCTVRFSLQYTLSYKFNENDKVTFFKCAKHRPDDPCPPDIRCN